MATRRFHIWWTIVCLAALVVVMVAAPVAAQDNGKRQEGEGKYAHWTSEWWQWLFSLPVSENPAFDETGAKAGTAQPNPKAFYLVGVFNESNTASRKITIPQNTPLFGPVINFQNDNVYNAEPLTVPQLRAQAAAYVDTATYSLELDGVQRSDLVARIKSPVFDYVLPAEDNIYQYFGVNITGRIKPAVSDGYWFYIPPLAPGTHTLRLTGSFPTYDPPFSLAIEYEITVQ